ncbi:MAG: 3'-5' exonuclease [Limnobacter sp.]|nr:3'-5' exonuclease [Limnobacter sp.]
MKEQTIKLDSVDPEAIAQWLENHPDFKVLRRLKPSGNYEGQINHPIKVIVVDTETTGLNIEQAELIEVGLVAVEVDATTGAVGRILGSYGELEDPGVPIPTESTAIHGITDEMVAGKQFDEDVIKTLCEGAQLVVAHNAGFDKPFMVRRFPWIEDFVWVCSFRELPLKQEGYASAKLENLLQECGYFHEAHRAVEDCNALLCFLAQPLKESQRWPFEVLFEGANEPLYEIAAIGAPFEKKDALKSKGFRWNPDERAWEYVAVGFAEGKEVIEWMRDQVYSTTDKIRLGFRIRSGKDRYSNSLVRQQFKEV